MKNLCKIVSEVLGCNFEFEEYELAEDWFMDMTNHPVGMTEVPLKVRIRL